jgi:peroxiredoxin
MARTPSTMLPLMTTAPAFCLPDIDGHEVAVSDFAGQGLLVMFLCNHCPFVIHIRDRLVELVRDWQARGLGVVAIMSNDVERYPADHPDRMREDAATFGYTFPYLFDATQAVALAYHAACTPDFFLFDRDHRLVYRGQLDKSRPGNGIPVTGEDLERAITALLSGQGPLADQHPSLGCNIKWLEHNLLDFAPNYPPL